LHIVIDEVKVFQTKERAPLLLCLEAFRPEELQFIDQEEVPKFSIMRQLKMKKKLKLGPLVGAREYDNYRSSSWDSANLGGDTDLIDPLIGQDEKTKMEFM